MSSALSSIETLEYPNVGFGESAVESTIFESSAPKPVEIAGIPEEEVARRVRCAREEAVAESEERARIELERARRDAENLIAERLREFEKERTSYFRSIEGEVVHLALAIARKIIQREADMDPTLLAGLVRIALDRMQCGPAARVRVAPAEAERWRRLGKNESGELRWGVIADDKIDPADCIVETELGTANFSFESQLRDVEESFTRLLAYRPAA